MYVEVKHIFI